MHPDPKDREDRNTWEAKVRHWKILCRQVASEIADTAVNSNGIIDVVAAVLITTENKIILCRRSNTSKYFPNKWEFPGGKIEKNETATMALKRELFEELKINVSVVNMYRFPNNIRRFGDIRLRLFIVDCWEHKLQINSRIHSAIMTIDHSSLFTIHDSVDNDKQFIPAIRAYLSKAKMKPRNL